MVSCSWPQKREAQCSQLVHAALVGKSRPTDISVKSPQSHLPRPPSPSTLAPPHSPVHLTYSLHLLVPLQRRTSNFNHLHTRLRHITSILPYSYFLLDPKPPSTHCTAYSSSWSGYHYYPAINLSHSRSTCRYNYYLPRRRRSLLDLRPPSSSTPR